MVEHIIMLVVLVVLVVEEEIFNLVDLLLVLLVEQQIALHQHQDGEIMVVQEVQVIMLVVEGVVEQVLLEPPELDHILLVLVDLVEMVSHILLLV
jgi:hypothetical protein